MTCIFNLAPAMKIFTFAFSLFLLFFVVFLSSSSLPLSLSMWCTHILMLNSHVYMYAEARGWHQILRQSLPISFVESWSLTWTQNLLIEQLQLAILLQGNPVSMSWVPDLQVGHMLCPSFTWLYLVQTQFLTLVWQTLYPWSHLPSPCFFPYHFIPLTYFSTLISVHSPQLIKLTVCHWRIISQ